jgi:hypothetical protein
LQKGKGRRASAQQPLIVPVESPACYCGFCSSFLSLAVFLSFVLSAGLAGGAVAGFTAGGGTGFAAGGGTGFAAGGGVGFGAGGGVGFVSAGVTGLALGCAGGTMGF